MKRVVQQPTPISAPTMPMTMFHQAEAEPLTIAGSQPAIAPTMTIMMMLHSDHENLMTELRYERRSV